MRHTHKKEIDGILFTVNEFSTTEGLRLLTRLTKLCGGSVAKGLEALPKGLDPSEPTVDFSMIGEAVTELTSRLDEDEIIYLLKRLLGSTLVEGDVVGGPAFDRVFQGRYLTLAKVVMFVLEANYKIPLDELMQSGAAVVAG